ncbi:hypothetical protein F5882DRAFT_461772 [Hyaloscypha sp. PMI_1271]|nr:hypothetical protein F5882DRAFT_461772 [Hyaloscypha sp. PMI_1271]
MALKQDTILLNGVTCATLAIVFLVPLIGLVWWMAWSFLLGLDESDGEFEPTAKNSIVVTVGERQQLAPAVELYTDNVSIPSTRTVVANGYLPQAYEEQRLIAQELPPYQSSTEPVETPQLEEVHGEEVEELEQPVNEANAASTTDVANPPRCQTIARFEYISQRPTGLFTLWISHPLIPLILSSYATILLIGLPIWIHEDRQYKLRAPSPTIKKILYLPLGMYLLSFYALKHRLRASLFERFDIPPPEPWKKMLSILPCWVGTGGIFKNLDTGEITVYDPRRRAFPWRAYRQPALIRTREYLVAYNASPGACTTFWGHSGRSVRTQYRLRPTIHRIGFVFLAICIASIGYWKTVWYRVPNVYEDILRHPKTIKAEDVARIFRILRVWQAVVFSGFWFFLLALFFAAGCMGNMLVPLIRTIWKYVPQEKEESIMREVREREQIRSEGRISPD